MTLYPFLEHLCDPSGWSRVHYKGSDLGIHQVGRGPRLNRSMRRAIEASVKDTEFRLALSIPNAEKKEETY